MRYTHACPKCRSSDIVRESGGAAGGTNMIPMGFTTLSAVPIARYVCLNCGLVEEWVEAAQDLARLRKKFGKPA
ncbi:MAG TPA: hypothetical protein VF755_05520, partial [Catenuloplanes sp.]